MPVVGHPDITGRRAPRLDFSHRHGGACGFLVPSERKRAKATGPCPVAFSFCPPATPGKETKRMPAQVHTAESAARTTSAPAAIPAAGPTELTPWPPAGSHGNERRSFQPCLERIAMIPTARPPVRRSCRQRQDCPSGHAAGARSFAAAGASCSSARYRPAGGTAITAPTASTRDTWTVARRETARATARGRWPPSGPSPGPTGST